MPQAFTLEVCVDSVESAIIAAENGATRLELCGNLVIGGTTPSMELFREVRRCTEVDVNVLIRPRFGDFHYTDHELNIMCREIKAFADEGAHGVVIGALNTDGTLDLPAVREMTAAAGKCHVTLHRAFDVCRNPLEVLGQAAGLGIDTILTSGQAANCMEGKELLATLIQEAPDGVDILVGAGVNPKVMEQLIPYMSAKHFHMSGKKVLDSEMIWRNPKVSMGLPGISEFEIYRIDGEQIRRAREILNKSVVGQSFLKKN